MASTRLCGCWLRSSFSLIIQFPILFIILATTFAAIAVGQEIELQVLQGKQDLITALPIPPGSTVSTATLTKTISFSGTTRSSDQISKISVFVTVNSASPTPDASTQSPLPSVKSQKGLAIGFGLGVPALCFLIFSTIWLIFRHRRNKRASEGSNDLLIAENKSQPMKKNPESLLLHELPDNQAALSELAENREQPPLLASRTELPTNSLLLAEMYGD